MAKKKEKKDLDKAYDLYVKRAAEYGIDPKSKDEFRKRSFNVVKVRKLKKKNTNFQIAKYAIQKQLASVGSYQEYLHKWKRAKKKGFIIATEAMPMSVFYRKRDEGLSMGSIIAESYQINMKQSKQLLKEAKQLGIKMSLTDLLSKGQGYQALMEHIDEYGWETLLSWSYDEGTTRKDDPGIHQMKDELESAMDLIGGAGEWQKGN